MPCTFARYKEPPVVNRQISTKLADNEIVITTPIVEIVGSGQIGVTIGKITPKIPVVEANAETIPPYNKQLMK